MSSQKKESARREATSPVSPAGSSKSAKSSVNDSKPQGKSNTINRTNLGTRTNESMTRSSSRRGGRETHGPVRSSFLRRRCVDVCLWFLLMLLVGAPVWGRRDAVRHLHLDDGGNSNDATANDHHQHYCPDAHIHHGAHHPAVADPATAASVETRVRANATPAQASAAVGSATHIHEQQRQQQQREEPNGGNNIHNGKDSGSDDEGAESKGDPLSVSPSLAASVAVWKRAFQKWCETYVPAPVRASLHSAVFPILKAVLGFNLFDRDGIFYYEGLQSPRATLLFAAVLAFTFPVPLSELVDRVREDAVCIHGEGYPRADSAEEDEDGTNAGEAKEEEKEKEREKPRAKGDKKSSKRGGGDKTGGEVGDEGEARGNGKDGESMSQGVSGNTAGTARPRHLRLSLACLILLLAVLVGAEPPHMDWQSPWQHWPLPSVVFYAAARAAVALFLWV